MRGEPCANLLWRICPFHSSIETFRVLTEDDDVHERLFEASAGSLANEIQRISGERNAGPNAGVEIEFLPHGYDGAEIGITLAPQFRNQFGFCLLLGLRSDGAK